MKKINLFCISLLTIAFGNTFAQTASKNISVLFIGNSYTQVNDLPNLVKQLAASSGDTINVSGSTPGGYTLQMHSVYANTLTEINKKPWDYVVLQEQSQLPSFDPQSVNTDVIPYAKTLNNLIHANYACSQTVFYMTWGRKYGDASNCPFYPPVCTFSGMQDRLKESYMRMADSTDAIVSPVGEAFRALRAIDSTIDLYQADYSHPSLEGSYLAACTFYEVLLHKSCVGNSFISTIDTATALLLQNTAHNTVRDSLTLWNIGANEPWSDFNWYQVGQTGLAYFNSMSDSISFQHFWDFGDGTTSTFANTSHQYSQNGQWPVYHLVFDSCSVDSTMIITNITGPNAIAENLNQSVRIFPNPAADKIEIHRNNLPMNQEFEISFFDIYGRVVFSRIGNNSTINLTDFCDGVYLVKIKSLKKEFIQKLIVKK